MNRSRIRLLASAGVVSAMALLGLPAVASADDSGTTTVLVSVDDCAAPAKGHASCYAKHLTTKRVKASQAKHYRRQLKHHDGDGPAGGFTPGQLATAYGVDNNADLGSGQVVAIVDAYHSPNALSHLKTFDKKYHFSKETSSTFKKIGQTGSTKLPKATNAGWAGETDLDLQAVRGLCRKCKILLVETKSASFADLAAGVNAAASYMWKVSKKPSLPVNIISNSYGAYEDATIDSAYGTAYDHPGKAITVSSGDDGWFGWDYVNYDHNGSDADGAASYPATLRTVVGVGGTALVLDSGNNRSTETVWNRNGDSDSIGYYDGPVGHGYGEGASGGGCSEIQTAATFQSAVSGYGDLGCGTKRSSVDVAALADPYTGYDIYTKAGKHTGWFTYGGTSLSSPLIAAMWALAGGPTGSATYPAANLYGHAGDTSKLYDVVAGANGLCGQDSASTCQTNFGVDPNSSAGFDVPLDCQFAWPGHAAGTGDYQCRTRTGFDGPSGVGTPKGVAAFQP